MSSFDRHFCEPDGDKSSGWSSPSPAMPVCDAHAEIDTDTLHIIRPRHMDEGVAAEMFRSYGDVARVVAMPGAKYNLAVVFFDVRAAAWLWMALGPRWCKAAPPMWSRTVKVPADSEIPPELVCDVAEMSYDPEGDGACIVRYFDSRGAEQLEMFLGGADPLEKTGAVPLTAISAGGYMAPAPTPELAGQAPWVEAGSVGGFGGDVDVLLSGLAESLCNGPCLQAVLGQAGLEGSVKQCQLRRGGPHGTEMLLTVAGRAAAEGIISHFDGRNWGGYGDAPVTASLCLPAPDLPERPQEDDGHPQKLDEPAYAPPMTASVCPPPPGLHEGGHPWKLGLAYVRSATDMSTTCSGSDVGDQEEKASDQ